MKVEVKEILKKAFHQEWTSPQGFHWETSYKSVSREEISSVDSLDYTKVNDVLAVDLSWVKTFTCNLIGIPKVVEVIVASDASIVEVLQAIAIAKKTHWYKKYCTNTPLYQSGYMWYTKEEMVEKGLLANK